MVMDPAEALAHIALVSQLVALAAALETEIGAQKGWTRAAVELRRLAEQPSEPSV